MTRKIIKLPHRRRKEAKSIFLGTVRVHATNSRFLVLSVSRLLVLVEKNICLHINEEELGKDYFGSATSMKLSKYCF
jgi:hypothetical protein